MTYEEPSKLSDKTLNMRRAIDSLREELNAVDLYNQRADAVSDPELKKILLHNSAEEKEHAAMLMEWMRRNDPEYDKEFKDALFKDGDIVNH